MKNVKYASFLLYLIVKSSGQPVAQHPESRDFFSSEMFRVRRQAGYVYEKPSVAFDLPAQAPTVSTQAPTVDRTRAQMMYYAYPAPAAGGKESNVGGSSAAAGSTATGSAGTASDGYSYGAQNAKGSQSTAATGSSSQSSGGSPGYGYITPSVETAPVSTETVQSSNTGSSDYAYNAPSARTSVQTNNADSSQTVLNSGYAYNVPRDTLSGLSVDVSTNAPKYLPPPSGSGNTNGIMSGSISKEMATVSSRSAAAPQPLDQYLPPIRKPSPSVLPLDQYLPPNNNQLSTSGSLVSRGPSVNLGVKGNTASGPSSNYIPPNRAPSLPTGNSATPPNLSVLPLDRYLPPIDNQLSAPESLVSRGPSVNVGEQGNTASGPSSHYIPPNRAPATQPGNSATPRPFSPGAPPTGYLPPNKGSQTLDPNSLSTPAFTYLPPVL